MKEGLRQLLIGIRRICKRARMRRYTEQVSGRGKNSGMKITFVTFNLRGGGAERMVSRLSNAFVSKGISVDIILLFDSKNISYEIDKRVHIFDCCYEGIKGKQIRKLLQVLAIRKYIKNNHPDVIFCYIITTLPFAVLANIGLGHRCKIIGSQRTNPRSIPWHYRAIVNPFLHICDGFVFQTRGARNCYPEWLKKKSIVIGNIAPDNCGFHEVNTDQMEICSVGRLHKDKDFETVIKAMAKVVHDKPEAKLHIYGEGQRKDVLIGLAEKLNVGDNIIFEGFVANISEELKKYDIFVFSSRAEGMPNALMEAMAEGLACVATDCRFGPSDMIQDGHNGYLVPVGDDGVMADRILDLLNNKEKKIEIMQEARKITEIYSADKIVDDYLMYARKIYEKGIKK